MRDTFLDLLANELDENDSAILLTADLGFGIFERFEHLRNIQYFNVGVAEQLMSSLAAGLSLEGHRVFTYSIGVFPTLRCLEQIRNDITYHDSNVCIVSSGAGFSYGSLGMSHHCVQDIGYMLSIPGIAVISPSNIVELKALFPVLPKTSYLRLDKSSLNVAPLSIPDSPDMPWQYRSVQNANTLVLFHGSIGSIAFDSCICGLFDCYSLPVLSSNLGDCTVEILSRYEHIVTIEEHSIVNGLFSIVSSAVQLSGLKCSVHPIALDHSHCSIVGSQDYLRNKNNLSPQRLNLLLEAISSES